VLMLLMNCVLSSSCDMADFLDEDSLVVVIVCCKTKKLERKK